MLRYFGVIISVVQQLCYFLGNYSVSLKGVSSSLLILIFQKKTAEIMQLDTFLDVANCNSCVYMKGRQNVL